MSRPPHVGALQTERMAPIDRVLMRPPTWRVVVLLAVLVRVAFVLAPFDVLDPVDAHELGRLLLEGHVPYRDFALEYPPGALLAFLLPGLAPASIAAQVLALQALVLDGLVLLLMREDGRRFRRYLVLSTVLFPLLSGGFDAMVMVCIAWSTALLARGDRRGWWLAGLGATVKLFPAVAWGWARRWGRAGIGVLVATVAVLAAPLAVSGGTDAYVGYHLERGVQQESIAASATYLLRRLSGDPIEVVYRFRAQELVGAETAGTVCLALFGALAAAIALRCWRAKGQVDVWLASFALLTVGLCASKVLSPQFLVFAAPAAAYLGGRWFGTYLVTVALTLVAFLDKSKDDTFMTLIAVRNGLLVVMALAAAWQLLSRLPAASAATARAELGASR